MVNSWWYVYPTHYYCFKFKELDTYCHLPTGHLPEYIIGSVKIVKKYRTNRCTLDNTVCSLAKMFSFTAPRMDKESLQEERDAATPEEQAEAFRDLYGKESPMPTENEDFITSSLDELQTELEMIQVKDAYDLALERCPQCIESREVRLSFLRAQRYDAKVSCAKTCVCTVITAGTHLTAVFLLW